MLLQPFLHALGVIFQVHTLVLIFIAVIVGLIVGIIPGLGGLNFLAMILPFIYGMQPAQGLAFLMAGNAVCHIGGGMTSILMGIPGTPANVATIIDGFPMTQQGKAGRALGAGIVSSGLADFLGLLLLALVLPFLRVITMLFTSREVFMLIVMALLFIGTLGSGSRIKGLISAGMGLFLAFVGYQNLTGVPRFTFGTVYLLDGVKLIPVVMGLFAIPEILVLMVTGVPLAKGLKLHTSWGDLLEGVKDVFRYWKLGLQSFFLGFIVGLAPGAGAETSPWIAYGAAKKSAKHPDMFGRGAVEGVISPQIASTSVKGGELVPTLSFGVPGSSGMAILLGAFLILGLVPGPMFLNQHADIAFILVGASAIGSIIATILCLFLAIWLVRIALVPGDILAPILLGFIALGAYGINSNIMDVVATFVFGALGYAMMVFDYNRAPLLLGLVLGKLAETYFFLGLQAYGAFFFISSPICIALLAIIVLLVGWPGAKYVMRKMKA